MEKNLYSITGMKLTDEEVREVYGIPVDANLNLSVLNQHMEEEIKENPEEEESIREEYHRLYRGLLQKLANRGLLVIGNK